MTERTEGTVEPCSSRIDTVFLPVTDFGEAVDWYATVLGFPVRWCDDENGYAAFDVGETALTLVRSDRPHRGDEVPFNFYTPDIEGTHDELRTRGVDVGPIADATSVRFFEFDDACGNTLAFCHYDGGDAE